jgi:hypothetical protein
MFCTPQVQTVPSIRWDVINSPENLARFDTEGDRYQGHLPDGSGVQVHSADWAYAAHRLVLVCHESASGRRLWEAKVGSRVIASHPRHDTARFMALAIITGA